MRPEICSRRERTPKRFRSRALRGSPDPVGWSTRYQGGSSALSVRSVSSRRETVRTARLGLRLLAVLALVAAWPAADALGAAPPNDDFDQAQPIRPGTTFRGTTVGATTQRGEPRPYPRARTVWYRFRPRRKLTVALAICPYSYLWADVSVYSGRSLRSLQPIDFRRGRAWHWDKVCVRRVAFTARPGRTYRIAVAAHGFTPQDSRHPIREENAILDDPTDPGRTRYGEPFGLRVRAIDAPANDDFADAAPIAVGESVRGTTYDATLELGEPTYECCTVWYRLRASVPTEIELTVDGATEPDVYTGRKVNRLKLVRDDYPLEAKPGVTYRIQVSLDSAHHLKREAQRRRYARSN
jgi:hypothetical protein